MSSGGQLILPDSQIAPDGQYHRQPDRDGVTDDGEVGVEEGEEGPVVGEHDLGRLVRSLVVVQRERDIRNNDHHVGDGHSRQDRIRSRDHISSSKKKHSYILLLQIKSLLITVVIFEFF